MAELICHVSFIFPFRCHAAADVALGLVDIKQLAHLCVKCGVNGAESFG